MRHINAQLAQELQVRLPQVEAAVQLFDEGASVRVRVLEVDLARKRIALSMKKSRRLVRSRARTGSRPAAHAPRRRSRRLAPWPRLAPA